MFLSLRRIKPFTPVLLSFLFLLPGTAAFPADGADSNKVSFRFVYDFSDRPADVRSQGSALTWNAGSAVKDSFDSVSGASVSSSTRLLKSLWQDKSGGRTMPDGLRALLLFAVSGPGMAERDALNVRADGKKLTVTFVHRGTAYMIETDDRGFADVSVSFRKAEGVAGNRGGVFYAMSGFLGGDDELPGGESVSAEQTMSGSSAQENSPGPAGSASESEEPSSEQPAVRDAGELTDRPVGELDWSLLPLEADIPTAAAYYGGKLRLTQKDGILCLRGTLRKKSRETR